MPDYVYSGVNKQGERVSGREGASDESDLAHILHGRGIVLIEASAGKASRARLPHFLSGLFGVPLTEKLLFMRNLRLMVASGIALPRALNVLSDQTRHPSFKKALGAMRDRVLKGDQLSDCMADHPGVFSDLFVNMVRVGEESGTMETVLGQLALQLEHEHDLRGKIKGALMYPAIILVAMVGIGILMLVLVVPNLAKTFKDLGVELPATTRSIIALGDFLSRKWYIAFPLLFLGIGGAYYWTRTKGGKFAWDVVSLRLPAVSGFMIKIQTAFTARTLSSLIGSGVPIVRSLEITSAVLGNQFFRNALSACGEQVRKGSRLSDALEEHKGLYPGVLVQMIRVGEETGQTGEILQKLAEFYEEEVSNITKNLATIIEPVLMLVIGAVVGFFAVSMIQPMYSMLGSIK